MTLRIENLTKVFPDGTRALRTLSFEVGPGVFGLLGPNGAGKTTLLRIAATLLDPTEGTVCWFDSAGSLSVSQVRRSLGYVAQDVRVVEDLTVSENIGLFWELRKIVGMSKRDCITHYLQMLGLHSRASASAKTLSGGERRRLGLAIAILHRPKLLICDEVTTSLDPGERVFVRNLLAEFGADAAVLFSTHIIDDIGAVADRLAVLVDGTLSFLGKPADCIESAASRVWNVDVSTTEVPGWESRHLVTAKTYAGDTCTLRIIADSPPEGGRNAKCRLEDAFLSILPRQYCSEFSTEMGVLHDHPPTV